MANGPLKWDEIGSRWYENGVRHGVLYVQDDDGSYKEGVVWNGLTSVQESPDGAEPNDLYADDIKYAVLRSAETFGATIEAYTYPEEFGECDGTAEVIPGVYLGQQARKAFGFVYTSNIANDTGTESDDGYKIHIIYNATASPSDRQYESVNDSPDAITFSWEITTTPVVVTNKVNGKAVKPVSTIVIDSTKITAEKLKAIEDKLYGTSSAAAALPTPDELITLMTGA